MIILNLSSKLKTSQVLVVLIPNEIYMKRIRAIRKQLARSYKCICYVSLNKMYSPLVDEIKLDGVDPQKFYFIDGITGTVTSPPEERSCTFLGSLGDLTGISLALSEALEKRKPEVLCFDSLSTLLIYRQGSIVTRFIHDVVGKVRQSAVKAVFTALEEDTGTQTIRELGMFVDGIVHVK